MTSLLFNAIEKLYGFLPIKRRFASPIEAYFLNQVKRELQEVDRLMVIANLSPALTLASHPAFRGLISGIIRSNQVYPTPKDYAAAISVALRIYNQNDENCKETVIDLSYHLADRVKEIIVRDATIKNAFHDIGKEPENLTTDSNRSEIKSCFNNKKQLFEAYFQSFNDSRFDYAIQIWHQGEEKTWIDWKQNETIIVNLDKCAIREGFFLSEFDYSIVRTGEFLKVATRRNGCEYFNDPDPADEDVIWRR